MCISSAPAAFEGTIGYVGKVQHQKHGLIHVLGYQNSVKDMSGGANSMILPFPSAQPMGAENISEGNHKILTNMVEQFNSRPRSLSATKGSTNSYVKVFQHGIYHVVPASNPTLVNAVLDQVPEEKRPNISPMLMSWYEKQYPGHAIAVCCFNAKEMTEAAPLFWWYNPIKEDVLFFPAVDSHSGGIPDLNARVWTDHAIVVGYDKEIANSLQNRQILRLESDTAAFFNPHIRCFFRRGEKLKNGDFAVNSQNSLERVTYDGFNEYRL